MSGSISSRRRLFGGGWRDLVRQRLADGGVASATTERLLRVATPRIFAPQQVIASPDNARAGTIVEGYAGARTSDGEGHEFLLTVMRRGQVFAAPFRGEADGPGIDLIGLTGGVVATLPPEVVEQAVETDHNLALRLLDWRGSVIRRLLSRLEEVQFTPASERLAVVLLAYAPLFASRPPLLTRSTLAGLIGTSREMLGSVIRDLEAAGIVTRSGRALIVLDEPRLRDAARWDASGYDHWVALRGPPGDDPLLDKPEVVPGGSAAPAATSP
jgi:CRP/FNR family cyclic AMP-dependent transcriptional regulator